jgi:hypothetical protein
MVRLVEAKTARGGHPIRAIISSAEELSAAADSFELITHRQRLPSTSPGPSGSARVRMALQGRAPGVVLDRPGRLAGGAECGSGPVEKPAECPQSAPARLGRCPSGQAGRGRSGRCGLESHLWDGALVDQVSFAYDLVRRPPAQAALRVAEAE